MTIARWYYQNVVDSDTVVTPSSFQNGVVGLPMQEGQGVATMKTFGTYSGEADYEYGVEIVASGEIGTALFDWTRDGVVIGADVATATTPICLESGIWVQFTTASGQDCYVGDEWVFLARNLFNSPKIFDTDRDTEFRSNGVADTLVLDLDFALPQRAQALILLDHNFTSDATIKLFAGSGQLSLGDGGGGEPTGTDYSVDVPYCADSILLYMDETWRYWQLWVIDSGNSADYLRFSELYLGPYTDLSVDTSEEWSRTTESLQHVVKGDLGHQRRYLANKSEKFTFTYRFLTPADLALLTAMFDAMWNKSTHVVTPVFFTPNTSNSGETFMVHAAPRYSRRGHPSSWQDSILIDVEEVPRSRD